MLAAVVTCVVAVAALLASAARGDRRLERTAKPIASLAFIAVGVLAPASDPSAGAFRAWILAGLVLAAAGDVALMFDDARAFLAGLALFLVGHVAYAAACASLVPTGEWADASALVPVVGGALALAYLWPKLGRMRGPVVLYVLAIGTMVTGALAVHRFGALPPGPAARLLAGALLFFASDLAVARDRFFGKRFLNRAWGLPAYYGGQLLIASALAP